MIHQYLRVMIQVVALEEGLAYDTNYATSVFMTLALAKETKKGV